jgi:hypothetical protein
MRLAPLLIVAGAIVAGCQTPAQFLDAMQPKALEVATSRARFDMNCPTAAGQVLSREVTQPVVYGGEQRAQYTIGIEGCGQRETMVVICPQGGDGCFAGPSFR